MRRIEALELLTQFVEDTPEWVKSMQYLEKYSDCVQCPFCGMRPEKIEQLSQAVAQIINFKEKNV